MNTCQWFFKCKNEATKQVEVPNSRLGYVDICDEHLAWLGDNPSPTQFVPPLVANHLERMKQERKNAKLRRV